MDGMNEPTRVLYVGETGPIQQQIEAALSAEPEFQLVDILSSTERLTREVYAAEPHIALVYHQIEGESSLDVIAEIAIQFPDVAIIAILPSDDITGVQQVMLAGARAFLIQPFTQINLLSTLRRIGELEARRLQTMQPASTASAEAERPLRTITVFSPRGGVGCSTIAVNLALNLLEETGRNVLLLEGKQFFGHLDVMLNIRTRNSIADLIPHANNLDDGLIKDVTSRHVSGMDVLLGPPSLQVAQGLRPDDVYNIFMGLQRTYDYIVIDAGSALTEITVTLMDAADRILVVTTPDLASLHDTSKFIQFSRTLAYPPDKILVALNRAGVTGGVRTRDVETALRHQVFAQIPDDGPNALRSLNRGVPLIVQYPRSPASKALGSLAKSLLDINAKEPARAPAPPAQDRAQRGAALTSG